MTERQIEKIKSQWDAGASVSQIVRSLPYSQKAAYGFVCWLREEGVLGERPPKRGVARVVNAYLEGNTDIDKLSEDYGYSRGTVVSYLNKSGIKLGRPKAYNAGSKCERTNLILNCLKKGEKAIEIAKKFGVSRQYVSALYKRSKYNGEL